MFDMYYEMNSKVVLIVALVVVGAILFAATKKDKNTKNILPKNWKSGEEVTLTANAIIGELEEEAMEALPPDLRPNVDDLALSDEEKTELFAILNDVTENGVLGAECSALGAKGSYSPLAASPMHSLLKKKAQLETRFRNAQRRMLSLKEKISGKIPPNLKAKMEKQIKQIEGGIKRNTAKRKRVEKQIKQLKAQEKAKAKVKTDTETKKSVDASLLVRQKRQLERQRRTLKARSRNLMKKANEIKLMENAKRISPKDALKEQKKLETQAKNIQRQLNSINKSIFMISDKIKGEKKRAAAEKKADVPRAREVKKAADRAKSAEKLLKESKAKAAQKEAEAKKGRDHKKKEVLEAKRRAEKARKMEVSHKEHDKKASLAEDARVELSKARVENEARAIAQEATQLKKEEDTIKQQMVRLKADNDSERRKISRRLKGAEGNAKKAPQFIERRFKARLEKAGLIKDDALRQRHINAARKAKEAEEERNRKYLQNQRRLALEQEENLRIKEKRQMDEYTKKVEKLRQAKYELEKRNRVVEKNLSYTTEMDAAAKVAQKQREVQQSKRSEQARASKMKQLELERKEEQEEARANAEIEKAKRDVAAKKAEAEKRRAEKRKADAERLRQKAEQAKKAREQRAIELEKGIEKITGKKSNSINLSSLDNSVLLELKVLMQASGGHPLLSRVLEMIKLKSMKNEEKESTRPSDEEFAKNFTRITGMPFGGNMEEKLHQLSTDVLEELIQYMEDVGMTREIGFLEQILSTKKLVDKFTAVASEHGVKLTAQMIHRGQVEFLQKLDIGGLDTLIDFLKSDPILSQDQSGRSQALLMKMEFMRGHKMAVMKAAAEASEEERAKKKQKQLEAIEKARQVKEEEELNKAAARLEEEKRELDKEVARVKQAVSAEKRRVEEENKREMDNIDREHEEKKKALVTKYSNKVKDREEELKAEALQKKKDIELEANVKIVEMKQAHAEKEEEVRAKATEALVSIEAEISNTEDPAVKAALSENLRVEQEARAKELEETAKSNALEQQNVVEETKLLKKEADKQIRSTLEEEKREAVEKLESEVQAIEEQKQDLIEKQEEVMEIEKEKVDLEGSIHTEVLEEEKRDVEEDREMIEEAVVEVEEETISPRLSKDGRVKLSRKVNPNGSSFIKLKVPSDLSPGQYDDVSIFLSKETMTLLTQYRKIHRKIENDSSLGDVSSDDKKVLAFAGPEFKRIMEQYVQQRKESVLARRELLVAQIS